MSFSKSEHKSVQKSEQKPIDEQEANRLFELGMKCHPQGKYQEAIGYFQQALTLTASTNFQAEIYSFMGRSNFLLDRRVLDYHQQNKHAGSPNRSFHQKALQCFDQSLMLAPDSVATNCWKGEALLFLSPKENKQARECLLKALELIKAQNDPSFISFEIISLNGLANIEFRERNYSKALDDFTQVFVLEPSAYENSLFDKFNGLGVGDNVYFSPVEGKSRTKLRLEEAISMRKDISENQKDVLWMKFYFERAKGLQKLNEKKPLSGELLSEYNRIEKRLREEISKKIQKTELENQILNFLADPSSWLTESESNSVTATEAPVELNESDVHPYTDEEMQQLLKFYLNNSDAMPNLTLADDSLSKYAFKKVSESPPSHEPNTIYVYSQIDSIWISMQSQGSNEIAAFEFIEKDLDGSNYHDLLTSLNNIRDPLSAELQGVLRNVVRNRLCNRDSNEQASSQLSSEQPVSQGAHQASDEVSYPLNIQKSRNSDVRIFTPMQVSDTGEGSLVKDNLLAFQEQNEKLSSSERIKKIIIPLNINNNWALLYIHFTSKGPNIEYLDPLGKRIPPEILQVITSLCGASPAATPVASELCKSYDSGPWIIEAARALVEGREPDTSLDMSKVREIHRAIISPPSTQNISSSQQVEKDPQDALTAIPSSSQTIDSSEEASYREQKIREMENELANCDARLAQDPFDTQSYLRKGELLLALDRFQEAKDFFEKAEDLNKNEDQGNFSLSYLDRDIQMRVLIGIANIAFSEKRYFEAYKNFSEALDISVGTSSSWENLQKVNPKLISREQGLERVEPYLQLEASRGDLNPAQRKVINDYETTIKFARERIEKLESIQRKRTFYFNEEETYKKLKERVERYDEVKANAVKYAAAVPSAPAPQQQFLSTQGVGKRSSTISTKDTIQVGLFKMNELFLYSIPKDIQEAIMTGNRFVQQDQFENAMTHYDKTLMKNEDLAIAHVGNGEALFFLRRFDEAVTSFSDAKQKTNKASIPTDIYDVDVVALNGIANCKLQQGNFQGAIEDFDKVLSMNITNETAVHWKKLAPRAQNNISLPAFLPPEAGKKAAYDKVQEAMEGQASQYTLTPR